VNSDLKTDLSVDSEQKKDVLKDHVERLTQYNELTEQLYEQNMRYNLSQQPFELETRNIIIESAVLSATEFSGFYIQSSSNKKTTPLHFYMEVVSKILGPDKQLVASNEQIGQYVLLPKEFSRSVKLFSSPRPFLLQSTHNGFEIDNQSVAYTLKYDYTPVYNFENFIVARVDSTPAEYISVKLKRLLSYIKHFLTFGYHNIEPRVIRVKAGVVVEYKESGFHWRRIFIPQVECTRYFGVLKPTYKRETMGMRLLSIASTILSKLCDNLHIRELVSALTVFLSSEWLEDSDLLRGVNKPHQKNVDENLFKTHFGICSGKRVIPVFKNGCTVQKEALDVYKNLPELCDECSQLVGWSYESCKDDNILIPMHCTHNLLGPLFKRQMAAFGCNSSDMPYLFDFYDKYSKQLLPIISARVMSASKWIEHLKPTQSNLYTDGRLEQYVNSPYRKHKTFVSSGFMKSEIILPKSLDVLINGIEERPMFRQIIGSEPDQNVSLGPYTYTCSKILSSLWNDTDEDCEYADFDRNNITRNIFYATGKNPQQIGRFVHEFEKRAHTKVNAASIDGSKWDGHLSQSMLLFEHRVLADILKGHPDFVKLLSSQLNTNGYITDRKIGERWKFQLSGTRRSGDQNTTLGNSVLNIIVTLYLLSKQFDVIRLLQDNKIALMCQGDDMVVLMSGFVFDTDLYSIDARNIGMDFKVDITDIAGASFLSKSIVPVYDNGSSYYALPLIGRIIQKCWVSVHFYQSVEQRQAWVRNNALNYMQIFSCVEPLHDYFGRIYTKYRGKTTKNYNFSKDRYWDLPIGNVRPLLEQGIDGAIVNKTTECLKSRYNFTDKQWDHFVSLMKRDKIPWDDEVFNKMVSRDTYEDDDSYINEPIINTNILKDYPPVPLDAYDGDVLPVDLRPSNIPNALEHVREAVLTLNHDVSAEPVSISDVSYRPKIAAVVVDEVQNKENEVLWNDKIHNKLKPQPNRELISKVYEDLCLKKSINRKYNRKLDDFLDKEILHNVMSKYKYSQQLTTLLMNVKTNKDLVFLKNKLSLRIMKCKKTEEHDRSKCHKYHDSSDRVYVKNFDFNMSAVDVILKYLHNVLDLGKSDEKANIQNAIV